MIVKIDVFPDIRRHIGNNTVIIGKAEEVGDIRDAKDLPFELEKQENGNVIWYEAHSSGISNIFVFSHASFELLLCHKNTSFLNKIKRVIILNVLLYPIINKSMNAKKPSITNTKDIQFIVIGKYKQDQINIIYEMMIDLFVLMMT